MSRDRGIVAVSAWPDDRLKVVWRNGSTSTIDVSDHINRYTIFEPLRRNADAFDQVSVGEWGWSVQWSDQMAIPSDVLVKLAKEQGAHGLDARHPDK